MFLTSFKRSAKTIGRVKLKINFKILIPNVLAITLKNSSSLKKFRKCWNSWWSAHGVVKNFLLNKGVVIKKFFLKVIKNKHPDDSKKCHYLKIFFFTQSYPKALFWNQRQFIVFLFHDSTSLTVWSIESLSISEKFVNFQKGVNFSVFGRNFKTFTWFPFFLRIVWKSKK